MQIVEPLLGTRAEVHVSAASDPVAVDAERQIIDEVRRLEGLFTVFDSASALNEFRRTGSTEVPELLEVAALANDWQQRSAGAFDPRLRGIVDLWDHAEITGATPSSAALAAAVAQRASSALPFDNLNAIAKGWIAQRALNLDLAIETGWLSLGGDIVHRGSASLTVGIEDPHRPYDNVAPLAAIEISNEALATSGGSRRWWAIDGRRYPKVVDPRTGLPVDHLAAATIVASDAATADVLATIAMVTEPDQTLELAAAAGAECLLIHADRSHTCSSDRFVLD